MTTADQTTTPTTTKKPRKKQTRTPSRVGKKAVTVWVEEAAYNTLKNEAETNEVTLETLCKSKLFGTSQPDQVPQMSEEETAALTDLRLVCLGEIVINELVERGMMGPISNVDDGPVLAITGADTIFRGYTPDDGFDLNLKIRNGAVPRKKGRKRRAA